MSSVGRWSSWVGLGLIAVSVIGIVLSVAPVAVIAGILGLFSIGIAVYDAIYYALERANLRRRAAKVRPERGQER
ncbi:hypothetical protein [Phytoactinopolyspora halotolerans]|uniref:Uncharacterized protein n=1 Tax=Phytoactinopolyspora halotolerans TaxID=1981512 RepID=A0A6L9S9Q4_9ACTN|nr:hypothetical protein [Phytoactinopolyspora halotolerans]NEE01966.1 hypothetical protein [Phytoactinopolyspora halotolerans]